VRRNGMALAKLDNIGNPVLTTCLRLDNYLLELSNQQFEPDKRLNILKSNKSMMRDTLCQYLQNINVHRKISISSLRMRRILLV
jgi:hypothetical protein